MRAWSFLTTSLRWTMKVVHTPRGHHGRISPLTTGSLDFDTQVASDTLLTLHSSKMLIVTPSQCSNEMLTITSHDVRFVLPVSKVTVLSPSFYHDSANVWIRPNNQRRGADAAKHS